MRLNTSTVRALPAWLAALAMFAVIAGCSSPEERKARFIAQGERLMAERAYGTALLEFRNAIQLDPADTSARVRAGAAAEKLGNFSEAVQLYQSAIAADSANSAACGSLGRLLVLAGAPDRALATIESALQASPDDALLLSVRAAARLQQGDVDSARRDAARAVALDAGSEDAAAVLGGILRRDGQPAAALALLHKAVGANPQSIDLRLVLAQLQLDQRLPAEAAVQLREVIRLEPAQLAHRYRLAQLLLVNKDIDGAEATLRDATKAYPERADAKLALAHFLATQRSQATADKYLAEIWEAQAGNPSLLLGIGDHYLARDQPEAAERAYREVVANEGTGPQGLVARNRLAALKLRRGANAAAAALVSEVLEHNADDADALALRADLALAKGDVDAAIADLRTLLRAQPDSVPIRRALARAHVQAGDPTLAEDALRAAVTAAPRDLAARLDLAELLLRSGKPRSALPVIEQLVKDDPGSLQALTALYQVQVASQDLDAALSTAGRITAVAPSQSLGYYLTGVVQLARHEPAAAARSFETAIGYAPADWRPYHGLAQTQLEQRRPAAAVATFERGMAATGPVLALVTELASLHERLGRPGEAMQVYEKFLALQPANDVAANNLALLLVTHRKDSASLARAGKLSERFRSSANPALLDTYGWVLHLRGQSSAAVTALAKAVALAPDAPAMRYHLGMAQLQAGQVQAARASLRAAVVEGAGYPGLDEARATLAQLDAAPDPRPAG